MSKTTERETIERFVERYRVGPTDATRQVERAVIGGDWGANGYTTVAQANELARLLALGPGTSVLDLGAGRGWPGLYLAAFTGCRVALADVPIEGLLTAKGRAGDEGIAGRAVEVATSASHLAFRASSFDAVIHTDVLC